MDQFLSRLLDKYGLLSICVAVFLSFILLWAVAHYNAAPGGNVSVLWGAVQYTKQNNEASIVVPIAKDTKSNEKVMSDAPVQDKTKSLTENIQNVGNLPPTISHDSSGVIPVAQKEAVPDDKYDSNKIEKSLEPLRAIFQLRALDVLESGREFAETPRGSYFYVSIFDMEFSQDRESYNFSESMSAALKTKEVSRFRDNDSDFEIHYPQNGSSIVVGFTSESDAARFSNAASRMLEVTITPLAWEKMPTLVYLRTKFFRPGNERLMYLKGINSHCWILNLKNSITIGSTRRRGAALR